MVFYVSAVLRAMLRMRMNVQLVLKITGKSIKFVLSNSLYSILCALFTEETYFLVYMDTLQSWGAELRGVH